jgi:hypothetical protein
MSAGIMPSSVAPVLPVTTTPSPCNTKIWGDGGFEPSKAEPTDLQPVYPVWFGENWAV